MVRDTASLEAAYMVLHRRYHVVGPCSGTSYQFDNRSKQPSEYLGVYDSSLFAFYAPSQFCCVIAEGDGMYSVWRDGRSRACVLESLPDLVQEALTQW